METTTEPLDLTKYPFPEVSGIDISFPTFDTDKVLLAEAERRGMDSQSNPYNKLVSTIFFRGGKLKWKEGVDPEFRSRAYRYFRAFIGSWTPKHEHKTAICALILSEIAEPQLDKS